MKMLNRRQMLVSSGGILGAGGMGWAWHRQRQRSLRVGLVGCGMRGMQLAGLIETTRWHDVSGEIVIFCDVDRTRAELARQKYATSAQTTQDFHDVIQRDDVDAIFIATPDHWHAPSAIAALQAGKHVYCEKPMTLTVAEGRQLVQTVESSDRVFLVGTQQRSHRQFQQACWLVRNGRLGQLRRIDISVPVNREGGPFSPTVVPSTLNWDRWLGPAPVADYCPERFKTFRFWYEYSGGSITDWGTHNVDIAQWAMGMDDSGPIEVSGQAKFPRIENGFNTPTEFEVEMKYANGVTIRMRPNTEENGILFEGDEGRIYVNRRRLAGKPAEEFRTAFHDSTPHLYGHERTSIFNSYNLSHVLHFFDCVLNGKTPISDVKSQHRSVTACHLANIALRLGRTVRWNPDQEDVLGDREATSMLNRDSRPV